MTGGILRCCVSVAALVLVIDSTNSGLHGAFLVGALDRLALVVERAARQASYLQQLRQFMVMPQGVHKLREIGGVLFSKPKGEAATESPRI